MECEKNAPLYDNTNNKTILNRNSVYLYFINYALCTFEI